MKAEDKAMELKDNFGELAVEVVNEIMQALDDFFGDVNDNTYWKNVLSFL